MKLLDAGHYDVKLSADETDRLITWMDTYVQRSGSFGKEQEQKLREFRHNMASVLDN